MPRADRPPAEAYGALRLEDRRAYGDTGISIYRLYFLHSLAGVAVAGAALLLRGETPASLLRLSAPGVSPGLVLATMAVVVLACLAIFSSIQALGAGRAAVLEISYPLFVTIFGWLLYRQPVQWPVILGGI